MLGLMKGLGLRLFQCDIISIHAYRSVVLHNRSDVVVHFQWKAFSSEADEELQREL
jgi:hypothetical protein